MPAKATPANDQTTKVEVKATPATDQTTKVELSGDQTDARESKPTRCFNCRKRVGLTGFKCRCENTYCGLHRYPEKHDCSFDYKTHGREALAKSNPLVQARKIDKI
jgi:predicted nucleic acid binding AN1-type Zn finger protein